MKLVASAIRLKDGRVFTGKRHSDAFASARTAGVSRTEELSAEQGFVSKNGIFLDRQWALEMLVETGQIKLPLLGSVLTSEDLW